MRSMVMTDATRDTRRSCGGSVELEEARAALQRASLVYRISHLDEVQELLRTALIGIEEALQAMQHEDGLIKDIEWNAPWLLPRLNRFVDRWRTLVQDLADLLEQFSEDSYERSDRALLGRRIRALDHRLRELEREECLLLLDRFEEPAALD